MAEDELNQETRRIADEKPEAWEYLLTAEVLKTELAPVFRRWDSLEKGLYSKPKLRVATNSSIDWFQDRIAEILSITESFTTIVNESFEQAWGVPGEPGNAEEIIHASRLLAEAAASALAWEETIRFSFVDDAFEPVRQLFIGAAGSFIGESKKLPAFLTSVLNDENASGMQKLTIVLKLPDDWAADVTKALKAATAQMTGGSG